MESVFSSGLASVTFFNELYNVIEKYDLLPDPVSKLDLSLDNFWAAFNQTHLNNLS